MTAFKALFVGLTTIDIQYLVEEFPKPNTKVKASNPEIFIGGPAANAAVAFSRLNGEAHLVSAIGKNAFSDQIYDDFQKNGLTYTDLLEGEDFTPVIATVITSNNNGNRTIFTHHPNIIQTDVVAQNLINEHEPEVVMLDGFYPEFAIQLARVASENSIPVVLDCGSWKPQYVELFKNTDFAVCSADFMPPTCFNSKDVIHYLKKNRSKADCHFSWQQKCFI